MEEKKNKRNIYRYVSQRTGTIEDALTDQIHDKWILAKEIPDLVVCEADEYRRLYHELTDRRRVAPDGSLMFTVGHIEVPVMPIDVFLRNL